MSEQAQTITPPAPKVEPPKPKPMKQWKVIVHNDDINSYDHVIRTFMDIIKMDVKMAFDKTVEVDKKGLSVVKVTHKEEAEFIQERLQSKSLTVTIEPD